MTVQTTTCTVSQGTFSITGSGLSRALNLGSTSPVSNIVSVSITDDLFSIAGTCRIVYSASSTTKTTVLSTMPPEVNTAWYVSFNGGATHGPYLADRCSYDAKSRTFEITGRNVGKLLTDQTLGKGIYPDNVESLRYYGTGSSTEYLKSETGGAVKTSTGALVTGWTAVESFGAMIAQLVNMAGLTSDTPTGGVAEFKYQPDDGHFIIDAITPVTSVLGVIPYVKSNGTSIGYVRGSDSVTGSTSISTHDLTNYRISKTTEGWARSDYTVYSRDADNNRIVGSWSDAFSQQSLYQEFNSEIMNGIYAVARRDAGNEKYAPILNFDAAVQLATNMYYMSRWFYRELECYTDKYYNIRLGGGIVLGAHSRVSDGGRDYRVHNVTHNYDAVGGGLYQGVYKGFWDGKE